jgi:uncharacterized membrane protein
MVWSWWSISLWILGWICVIALFARKYQSVERRAYWKALFSDRFALVVGISVALAYSISLSFAFSIVSSILSGILLGAVALAVTDAVHRRLKSKHLR